MSDPAAPVHAAAHATGLHKDFHGVPMWGWLAIIAVVGGGIYYAQGHRKPATPAPVPVAQGAGYTTVGAMPLTTTADTTRILTNSEWATAAEKDLIQKGHNPTDVSNAVQNYVNGEKLTPDQSALIDIALQDLGPLPMVLSGAAKVNALHAAKGGNLIGQMAAGLGNLLGLNDPNNVFAPFVDPFLNDVIDQGPISGVFQGANDFLGGALNVSGSAQQIVTPFGTFQLGGNVGTSGVNVNGGVPGVGNLGVSVDPTTHAQTLANYTVQPGDTLSSISMKVYGNTGGQSKIYSANLGKITDTSNIPAGTVLTIPAANSNA